MKLGTQEGTNFRDGISDRMSMVSDMRWWAARCVSMVGGGYMQLARAILHRRTGRAAWSVRTEGPNDAAVIKVSSPPSRCFGVSSRIHGVRDYHVDGILPCRIANSCSASSSRRGSDIFKISALSCDIPTVNDNINRKEGGDTIASQKRGPIRVEAYLSLLVPKLRQKENKTEVDYCCIASRINRFKPSPLGSCSKRVLLFVATVYPRGPRLSKMRHSFLHECRHVINYACHKTIISPSDLSHSTATTLGTCTRGGRVLVAIIVSSAAVLAPSCG